MNNVARSIWGLLLAVWAFALIWLLAAEASLATAALSLALGGLAFVLYRRVGVLWLLVTVGLALRGSLFAATEDARTLASFAATAIQAAMLTALWLLPAVVVRTAITSRNGVPRFS